eukprot:CAMPEP_0183291864 /NCGR_PEP_ID=MMETSP0160_2-20130417/1124_1 /TAXON_ID=2839 ORGANISM="Odontella Sinensis, Strain Grunow 1884" /NCGR_SAMPLE_ID=MMETSP0160_2 /ASSEMBLY_ACC=CAM_ASM_000250 /LENGTH=321 /DNA_ID=CAMNT_0025452723 /DNA_START=55 /DNA_END=1020 /DNA_ORIENTATION=+
MKVQAAAVLALAAVQVSAFVPQQTTFARSGSVSLNILKDEDEKAALDRALGRQLDYEPASADTAFAKKYASLKGAKIRTVAETFAEFTDLLGKPVNALYKNMVTDIVGSTHLTVVCARFQRDPVWSLGAVSALDLLFKNYPEPDTAADIRRCFFQCNGMEESVIVAEAQSVLDWAAGKSKEDIEAALCGEGDGPIAETAKATKADEFWMYSRFFGIGLVRLMELAGVEQTADDTYPVMEEWMSKKLEKPFYTACSDSDTYFKIKGKLDMMETMMKEIEIREKKRMAQRLEEKAEAALRKAERDSQMQAEIVKEAVEKATAE